MESQDISDEISFEGILEKIEKNESKNPKAPAGFVYFENDSRKFTVWGKTILDKFIEKGLYKITFTEKENLFNNVNYKNYTIKDVIDKNLDVNVEKMTFTKKHIEEVKDMGLETSQLKEGKGNIPWEIMGYSIILDNEIKEIRMPKCVVDYLIKLKSNKNE